MKKILSSVLVLSVLLLATLVLVEGRRTAMGQAGEASIKKTRATQADSAAAVAPKMVSIYSEWCAACRKMKPVVDKLAEACDGKGVSVERVDYENPQNEELMHSYEVEGLPTFLFIDEHGIEVDRQVGAVSEDKLSEMLSFIRGEDCSV